MGTGVLPAVDNKGKQPLHPIPDEVVLPPTAEEDPKTPEGGDNEGMEEPPSNKRRNYGHYHQEDGPTHFCKVILAPKLECIPVPLDFTKHFVAVPTEFKLSNNTGCSWKVTVKLMNGRVTLDQGWATYAAVNQIKIGYMVTFKLLPTPSRSSSSTTMTLRSSTSAESTTKPSPPRSRAGASLSTIESALNCFMFMVYA
ncbi:hypothetical protein CFC21_083807 [Triticum aestivum]|uniref:TF-B3 domain-containing protein n=2 Tax=Triticum aestivum TaxID=4565 RepID=A0A9R1I8L4_WHEAT|nr:hypothetical protein CFC21_083807 [Triticum aestivum]